MPHENHPYSIKLAILPTYRKYFILEVSKDGLAWPSNKLLYLRVHTSTCRLMLHQLLHLNSFYTQLVGKWRFCLMCNQSNVLASSWAHKYIQCMLFMYHTFLKKVRCRYRPLQFLISAHSVRLPRPRALRIQILRKAGRHATQPPMRPAQTAHLSHLKLSPV